MKIKNYAIIFASFVLLLLAATLAAASPDSAETDVRDTVERAFEQLKAGQYGEIYDALPSASRAHISRERFVNALQRVQGKYQLDRLEVGAIRVSGPLAVVETVMYGRLVQPVQSEGKIAAQQYLVREDGQWRVATGDRSAIQGFLAANPRFARRFPFREPKVFIKQDGRWVDLGSLRAAGRRVTSGD